MLSSAFTLTVYNLLYVFKSEAVVLYIFIVNVQFLSPIADCFDPNRSFFLGVHLDTLGDNVEEPSIS